MDCRVVVEAAMPVYDVETADEAIRIAISKTGDMLNPDLSYVEIDVGTRSAPSGEALDPAFVVADEALVALELEITVFNVEREEHASRIARKEIGQRLHDIPLDVLDVRVLTDNADDSSSTDTNGNDNGDGNEKRANGGTTDTNGAIEENNDEAIEESENVLPEFEDLLDE